MADYIIKQGDTLSAIAKANNTSVESLAKANEIADPNKIIAGATLRLPGADINASEVQSGAPIIEPPTTTIEPPTTGNAILDYTKQEQERITKEKEVAQKSMGTSTSGYTGLIEEAQGRPTIDTETKLTSEMQESGATQLQKQVATQNTLVATIKGEVEKLDIQEQNEIDNLEKSGVTRGAIDREKSVIQRRYASQKALKNAELSAQAAVLSAMQGNFTMAKQAAQDAVDAYTYDYQQNVKTFDTLFSLHADWINDLDEAEQNLLKTAANEAQNELDNITKEKSDVGDLMIKYNQFGAGITLDDTSEEAAKKASQYEKYAGATIVGSAETGYRLVSPSGEVLKEITSGKPTSPSTPSIDTTSKYIQDPNNPNASIPNPNYGKVDTNSADLFDSL